MPDSYKVQALSINIPKPASVESFLDTRPKAADSRAVLGAYGNLNHDLVMDFAFAPGSSFMEGLNESDTSGAFLAMFLLRPFYNAKEFPADSLPLEESMGVSVSWKLDVSNQSLQDLLDSLNEVTDASWRSSLEKWENVASADTVVEMSVSAKDTSVRLQLPMAMVDSMKKIKGSAHLQVRLSAPEAKRVYRFYGDNVYPPIFALYSDSTTYVAPTAMRMANIVTNNEECAECPILHGGVYDSLVVELPSEPIMKALSEYYGDEFPFEGGNDVRQTVVMALLTMSRDDSQGINELGLPIQVVVGSLVDSGKTVVRRMENYRLNDQLIMDQGHQNLVFHEGDSLSLQLTLGARDFLNKAHDGRTMKFIMRMGYPFLQEKDTTYKDYITDEGDTSRTFFTYFDYARYDFSSIMEKPMTLKLWLASKREENGEED